MRRWRSFVCLSVVAVAVLAPERAAAQGPDRPRWEVLGAYTYLRDPRTDLAFPRGWLVGVARRLGSIWVMVEVDSSARTLPLLVGDASISMSSLMAGARADARVGPFREFAHVQVGRARVRGEFFGVEDDRSRFAVQSGVGLEYPFGRRFAARVQFDARAVSSDDGSRVLQLRGATGLAYSFR